MDRFSYTYDGLQRLTAVGLTNAESFTLDPASNIATRTGPAASYTYDSANRVTSDGTQSFTWNNADRLTNRGADTFGYDPLDRMTSSTIAGTARTYAYNGDGLLQSRTQGTATAFLWDPATSPSRLLQVGSDRLVYGLGPLYAVKADGSTLTFARDGGKSIRSEVNGSGTITASFRYRAYGAIAQSSGASTPTYLGYAGQLVDPSGLLYMRARWYDPVVGRFLTRDPLAGDAVGPVSLNVFAYANANPVLLTDPTGLCAPNALIQLLCSVAQKLSGLLPRFGQVAPRASRAAQRVTPAVEETAEEISTVAPTAAEILSSVGLRLSSHAARRLGNRGVTAAQILETRTSGPAFVQPGGELVYLAETEAGRFFYFVENVEGLIVTVSDPRLTARSLTHFAQRYGWTPWIP